MPTYNIYCDESCHLHHDAADHMVIGAVWCLKDRVPSISQRLTELKGKHGLRKEWELKWTKISVRKLGLYKDLIDFFFDDDDLHFRASVAPKALLRTAAEVSPNDEAYYNMFFYTLAWILDPAEKYNLYLDYKDTNTAKRTRALRDYLCESKYDFDRKMIEIVQPVRSDESALLQIADFLTGAIGYAKRHENKSPAKAAVVEHLRHRSGVSLSKSTLLGARKFNLFFWPVPQE